MLSVLCKGIDQMRKGGSSSGQQKHHPLKEREAECKLPLLIKYLKIFTSNWGKKLMSKDGGCHGMKVPRDRYRKTGSDLVTPSL